MPKPNQFYFDLAKSGDYDALVEAITNQQFNPLAMSPHGTTVWHYLAEGVHYDKLVQAPLMSLHVLHNFAEFILDNIRIDNYEEIHHILVQLKMKSKFNDNSIEPLINKFKEFLKLINEEIDSAISLFWGMIDATSALEGDLKQAPMSSSSHPCVPTERRELRFSTKVLASDPTDQREPLPESEPKRLRIDP